MNRLLLATAIVALYLLHQDLWFWRDARPLVFGFLPVGLAYHALYCLAVTGLMWALTRIAWPSHLEASRRSAEREGGPH
jgi:hypothetical protein